MKPDQGWVDVVGRLKPGTSQDAAAAALTAWASAQRPPERPREGGPDHGVVHVRLRESRGVLSKDRAEAMLVFMPIFFAFGLILMIGCANVANLLLARGLSRHREIGVRLSLGATRGRIVRQLLTENLLLALVAAVLAFFVSRALLAGSLHMAMSILPPEFVEPTDSAELSVPAGDWRVLAFLFGGAFVSTVMFGLVPALHSTRLELVRAMRGEVTRDARPSRVRQVLIGTQVTASALLLVCAAVFLRSTYSAATADVGVRTDDTVVVSGLSEPARPAMLHAIRDHPSTAAVAASWPQPTHGGLSTDASVGDTTLGVGCKLVSPEYFDLLGIKVLRGRLFAPDERSPAAGVVVISDAVAQRFWPNGDALGQLLRLGGASGGAADDEGAPQVPARLFTVIGVVRDVHSALRIFDFGYSGIYLPTTPEQARTSLVLRVHGDPDTARRTLLDALTKVDPALAHHDDEDDGGAGRRDSRGGLLDGRHPRQSRPGAHGVRPVRRAVVSRRAAQDGDRRADGARGDAARHRDARAVAVDAADRDRCRRRRRTRGGDGHRAPVDAGRGDDWHDGAGVRSGGLRRQSRHHRRDVSRRGVLPGAPCGAHRPDCDAARRLIA